MSATPTPQIEKNVGVHATCVVMVKEGMVEQYLEILYSVMDAARKTTPEFLGITIMQDATNPRKIRFVETWGVDAQWVMDNHMPKPIMQDFFKRGGEMIESKEFEFSNRMGSGWSMFREGSATTF